MRHERQIGMKLSKAEQQARQAAAAAFNQALDDIHATAYLGSLEGQGDEADAVWNLNTLKDNPRVRVPAEAYVNFVSMFRIDWESDDLLDKVAAAAIKDINSRPYIQFEYAKQHLPTIESNIDYLLLDSLYGGVTN